ncbi:hypothetical protein [Pseudomonas violetae]|uniref:Uncharacterized protein n=1 Tax=Pseudomonas violetae TaxID=2915813 RepID=A0ABT0ETC3_9PSED|nr:hypothetical protein [Pseudomonas violetae]MCK1788989.1 hypothetical protein [Pseudomonas violetae]
MFSSKVGRVTAVIFDLIALLLSLACLMALLTFSLNGLEIASIFSRWFGTDVWTSLGVFIGTGLLSCAASKIANNFRIQAYMVAAQERMAE